MGLQDAKIVKIGRKASVKPIKSKPGLCVWRYCTAGLLMILTYVEHKSFEVFSLGVVDAHGVVGGLCHLMEYAHLPAGLDRKSVV